jgi:small subunit ribosomal protein S20
MPNTKSAKKRMRRDEVVKLANKSRVRAVKTAVKKCDLQCSENELSERIRKAQSLLDRAARLRLVSPQRAGRLVGRLMHKTTASK